VRPLIAIFAIACGLATPTPSAGQPALSQLRIIAPAAPGGGWDQTARAMQQALQRAGIVRTPVVENIPGAAGTIGLARFIGAERGNGDAVMVSGLIMLGGIVTHHSPVTLADTIPLARITGEYEVIAVHAASPFKTLGDLLGAFKQRPESISWGGGSAGGSDQILAGLVAKAVGVEPRRVTYIAFSGGGESLSAILGGQVSAGINGLAEFAPHIEAGTLRVLAISSGQRLPGLDAPTLREQGVDVEFENWRSVVAPPAISAADRRRLDSVVQAMVRSPEWRETLSRYRWLDRYLAGKEFEQFAAAEEARVRDILRELGTGQEGGSLAGAGPYPMLVLAGLAFFGIAALTTLRSGPRRTQDARRPKLRSVSMIAIGAVLNLALTERAGFVLASAALFWFVARAFDEGHPARDAVFALGISLTAYLLFARVLQLQLPAGVFAGLVAGWA
jgi:putative tricarboxylic transport membrane protein